MQNAAFAAAGLDGNYVAVEVEPDDLATTLDALRDEGFVGANVTAPYKRDIARLVETELESVNTLVLDDGRWRGLSTDAAVLDRVRFDRAAIVGDGGAAAAFRAALPDARVFSRRGDWPPDVSGFDLVVHATPVVDEPVVRVGGGQTLVDLPYPASATAEEARRRGARVLDGLEVLVAQGARSFELWTGIAAPVEAMRRAVGLPRDPDARDSG
jgi:shikimate dehydrogenase